MRVRGPNNIGKAVQTDPTSLHYASEITEQNNCWELLVQMFNRFQTLHNNSQQHASGYCANGRKIVTSNNVATVCTGLDDMQQDVQTEATCNIQHCCVRLHGV